MSKVFPSEAECGHHVIFGNIPIRTYAGDHAQISVVDIPPGGIVEPHSHANEQMGMVVAGRAVFRVGEEEKTLGPGDLYCIPGGVRHSVIALDEPVKAVDVFYPIRDEYR